MGETIRMSNLEARRFLLAKQGLWPPRALNGAEGVLEVFARIGGLQYDPLNVVGRNPDLVVQSRVADHRPELLYEMTYEWRRLYDYWDKMMSILPVEEWPKRALQREVWRARHAKRMAKHAEHVDTILAVVRGQGPASSLDFNAEHGVEWKTDWRWGRMRAAKALLEMLLDTGDLMVSHREGARRYYDLPERVLPAHVLAEPPLMDEEAYFSWRVARRCHGIGLVGPAMGGEVWAGVGKAAARNEAIEGLVACGEMTPVRIEGDHRTYHLLTADLGFLAQARETFPPPQAAFLAPLDNLLWSRNLVERLFDFRYIWEVYKPAQQREYGYYVLPVLYGERFVARFDAKLDREGDRLRILSWHWEPGEGLDPTLAEALVQAMDAFLAYLGAERVSVATDLDPAVRALWDQG
jgi:uncharacterized protein YcaQ